MATLVQGLEREAEKKGLTGAEKHRYIGGAIRNMEKRGEITIHRKPAAPKPVKASHKAHTPTPVRKPAPAPAPAKKPYSKPTVTKTVSRPAPAPTKKVAYTPPAVTRREPLELIVKRNAAASAGKNYDVYSLYHKKSGTIYDAGNFRKRSAAAAEAKIEMDRHNHPRGEHLRGRLA